MESWDRNTSFLLQFHSPEPGNPKNLEPRSKGPFATPLETSVSPFPRSFLGHSIDLSVHVTPEGFGRDVYA